MNKKQQSIVDSLAPWGLMGLLLLIWQLVSSSNLVPSFLLPSPMQVAKAFAGDFFILMSHAQTTLYEAFTGLGISILLAFFFSVLMDRFPLFDKAFYPVLVVTQTIPTVAIAPLLVLWMGFYAAPKIALVVIVCFFPLTVSLLQGYKTAEKDMLNLMYAMGASPGDIFRHVKLPYALEHLFAGLRISVSYAIVGAVIAEWLGGFSGLGIYMTRVRKAYAYDKMFAVILLTSVISLVLIFLVQWLEQKLMPWKNAMKIE